MAHFSSILQWAVPKNGTLIRSKIRPGESKVMRMYRFCILSYKSLYNFGLKSYQNCPCNPQKGFFAELHLTDFCQLLETHHAAKSEKKSFRLILRLKLIFNAVLQNNEILDSNYNWSQLAFLEAYYIKNHDSIINHGLKNSKSLII